MGGYAADTTVPVERSKHEIERTLERYKASEFAYAVKPNEAMVGFLLQGRHIRFTLPLPGKNDDKFRKTPTGRIRRSHGDELAMQAYEQACRQRWRALALTIKAKLEAVDSGIASIEEEFLGYMVLPNGDTFAEWATPQLEKVRLNQMPKMLMAGSAH
jgi:hypothetical protein